MDQHVPLQFALPPSLLSLVKAAVLDCKRIDPFDKAEILETLGHGHLVPMHPGVPAKQLTKSPKAFEVLVRNCPARVVCKVDGLVTVRQPNGSREVVEACQVQERRA